MQYESSLIHLINQAKHVWNSAEWYIYTFIEEQTDGTVGATTQDICNTLSLVHNKPQTYQYLQSRSHLSDLSKSVTLTIVCLCPSQSENIN